MRFECVTERAVEKDVRREKLTDVETVEVGLKTWSAVEVKFLGPCINQV